MLGSRDNGRPSSSRLEGVTQELAANNQAVQELEEALALDPANPFLLKKYERLSKREQLLLEERKLWAGAALQNHSWQAGLQAAPGVKALLSRLVLASAPNADLGEFPDIQRAITAANLVSPGALEGSGDKRKKRRYNTRKNNLPSPDKAQLMLLADVADASGTVPLALDRMLSGHEAHPDSSDHAAKSRKRKRGLTFGSRFKPFHVAKVPEDSDLAEEGAPVEVPVMLCLEERIANYARTILEGAKTAPQSDLRVSFSTDAVPSDSSRESREGAEGKPPSLLLQAPEGFNSQDGSKSGFDAVIPGAESLPEANAPELQSKRGENRPLVPLDNDQKPLEKSIGEPMAVSEELHVPYTLDDSLIEAERIADKSKQCEQTEK